MYLANLVSLICLLALSREGYATTTPLSVTVLPSRPTAATQPSLSSKYVVYQEQKTWDEAKNFCDKNGMTLAYIMTYEEQKAVRDYIKEHNWLPKDEQSGYWLGARAKDKIWRWDFNQEDPRNEHFMAGWHWYKPDYKVRSNGEVEECMELQYINKNEFTKSLAWNDLWCNEKRAFICQVIPSPDLEKVKEQKEPDDAADLKKIIIKLEEEIQALKKQLNTIANKI